MGNSKVIFGNETLIDLTGDTVTPDTLLAGTTAHNRSGNQIVGTATVPDTLDDLTDVELTSPAEGDLLQYDATEQKWVNSAKIPQKVAGLQKTGCVNRLKCTATSQVLQGVTCTVNDDKSVTLSGGPAQEAFDFHYSLEGSGGGLSDIGTYRLVGCPVGGGSNTYRIFAYIYAGSTYVTTIGDVGKGAPLTLASGQRCPVINIVVSAGADFTNPVTIKPMITDDLSATYDDYQPYSMTNRELTEANSNLINLLATKVTTSSFIYKTTVQPNGEAYIPLKYQCTIVIFVVRHDIAGNVYVYTGYGADWFYSAGLLKIHESSNKISINGSKAQTDHVLTVTSTETYAMTVYAMYLNIV